MCRSSANGGRRCNHHNRYGILRRNLQAQKQYHQKQSQNPDRTPQQRQQSTQKKAIIMTQLNELRQQKQTLGPVTPHTMQLTAATEQVLAQLEQDGYAPYIVGGSVRDDLLNLENKDIDIEVYNGTPQQIADSLKKIGPVNEVGRSFGVLKITIDEEEFDISLPRTDNKTGNGHTGFDISVDPHLSLPEATARRDYTINALMYHHSTGFIIDNHNGLTDLRNKQLKHVSEAYDEDPLRVLRGVQMASRFNMELHPDTISKAQSLKTSYKELAVERVQIEFQKLYTKGNATHKAFQLLKATQWDENFPGLAEANDRDLHRDLKRAQTLLADGTIHPSKKPLILSAVIVTKLKDEDAQNLLQSTTVGDTLQEQSYLLSRLTLPRKHGKAALRSFAYHLPRIVTIQDWIDLQKALGNHAVAHRIQQKATTLNILNGPTPDILTGRHVLPLTSKKPGPWLGTLLTKAREAQYSDQFTNLETGKQWLAKYMNAEL